MKQKNNKPLKHIERTIEWNTIRGNTPDTLNYQLEIDMLQEELDEFLCPDIDEPIEKEIQPSVSPLKNMESDIMGFKEAEEEILPVTLTYSFDSKEAAKQFQTEIAENGLTSSYDDEDKLVDVIYHEGVNESDLKILSDTLVNACTNTSAEYKGFHFNMV